MSTRKLADLVEHWRSDAVQFVRDQFGAAPSPHQVDLLRAASAPGAHVATKSGHGTGKTTTLAWLILWALCCFDNVKIPCTAPTAHQLKDALWPEVRIWAAKMIEPWKSSIKVTSDRIEMEGLSGFAVARTGRKENPEALQGFHASDLLVFLIDEASGIDDTVFEVARGSLSTPDARVIMTANPTRTSGFFYQAFNLNRERWDCLTFSCEESPLVSQSYIDEMRNEYGEDSDIYRVRVLGEFPSGGDMQFIRMSDIEAAAVRQHRDEAYMFAPVVLGVDVAWYGGDRSVIVKRQGLYSEILWSKVGCELSVLAGIVADLWSRHDAEAVFIDATGVGAGVVSNLRMMGRSPFAVMFGGGPTDPQYRNKRAECWGLMRDWLTTEQGMIPNDPRLKTELAAPEYCRDLQGRLLLERKEDMRKRGLSSPDYADALSLTFAYPVTPGGKRYDGSANAQTELAEYDPFVWGREV